MPTLTSPRTTLPRSAPQKPTLEPCPGCGATVLTRIATQQRVEWHNPQTEKDEVVTVLRWEELQPTLTPFYGKAHVCQSQEGIE